MCKSIKWKVFAISVLHWGNGSLSNSVDMLVATSHTYSLPAVLVEIEEDGVPFPVNKKQFNYSERLAHSTYNLIYSINKGITLLKMQQ